MIIFFSGNGNSKSIAVALSEALDQSIIDLRGQILLNPESFTDKMSAAEPVIWVFPVYSWGVPPVVLRFIQSCNLDCNGNKHYLVLTCGDDCGLTSKQWQKAISKRGWTTAGKTSVFMPNTYVLMKGFDVDSKDIEQQKIEKAKSDMKIIAEKINNEFDSDETYHGKFAWIKSKVIYPWFVRYAMSPKPFAHNKNCISCGRCAMSCPMDNITMINKYPIWGDKCALCLSCYHKCPKRAVTYGKVTEGKGQYTYPE